MAKKYWGLAFELPESFGDMGEHWIEGRAIVWKAFQMDAIIKPPTIFDDKWPNFGWWLGLADFLSFACGALDVAEYLHEWRELDHEPRSSVENFVVKNWGNSLALLELYLWNYEHARREVYLHNHLSRSDKAIEEDLTSPSIDTVSGALEAAQRAVCDENVSELARGIFMHGVESVSLDRPDTSGDPSHFGDHFAFGGQSSTLLLSTDDEIVFSRGGARLSTKAYAGWYAKLHELRRICERDPDTSGEANRVEVSVEGIGVLGDFTFDPSIDAFVMERHQPPINDLVVSPRYGFELTQKMVAKLRPLLADSDRREDQVIEQVDLQIREEVDLAHSLTYEIGGGEEQDQHWTRLEGEWREGFMFPEGVHHKRCTKALIDANKLDHTMPWHQAVLFDTTVYPVSPWALGLVTKLWDMGNPVRTFIGQLAGMEEAKDLTNHFRNEDYRELLLRVLEYVEELPSFIKADESFLVEDLLEWKEGRQMTAKELLAAIVEAESNR